MKSFNIAEEFVVLSPDKVAYTVTNSPTVYQELARDFENFKGHELIALHNFHEDWPNWEVHPHGDETIVLLSGKATLVIKLDDSDHEVTLVNPGDTYIVPTAAWHTARIAEPTSLLFITPGEGTLTEYENAG